MDDGDKDTKKRRWYASGMNGFSGILVDLSRIAIGECRSRVIFLTLGRGYRSRSDGLDREDVRPEEVDKPNQEKRLVSFQAWCEMRDGASAALEGIVSHKPNS